MTSDRDLRALYSLMGEFLADPEVGPGTLLPLTRDDLTMLREALDRLEAAERALEASRESVMGWMERYEQAGTELADVRARGEALAVRMERVKDRLSNFRDMATPCSDCQARLEVARRMVEEELAAWRAARADARET